MALALPVCLTIAGSDSGGGAGIQADLKTFQALGCFGTSAITAITAQNPDGVRGIHPIPAANVGLQVDAVLEAFHVGGIKTGMLFSAEIIDTVAGRLAALGPGERHLVVDPVMVATSGAKLLQDDAIAALQRDLLPLASVVTPNLPEAAILAGIETIPDRATAERVAQDLAQSLGVPVLLKGGHGDGKTLTDLLATGEGLQAYTTSKLDALSTHGTGCTLSAAIAARLAQGDTLADAVQAAKAYVHAAIANARQVGPSAHAMHPHPDWQQG